MRHIVLALCLGLTACATTPADQDPSTPASPKAMISAANPLAVDAGLRVLKAGGTAVDAAVAIQSVLGLVEPQSSGLGGGAFMTYYDAKTRKITVYDGREVAPKAATPDQFLDAAGDPLPFFTAVLGGTATGVPGAVAMLDLAHQEHGKLAWAELFADAEKLADQGFVVSPRLSLLANSAAPQAHTPDANAYFTHPDGTRIQTGDQLVNPDYGATLRLIAAQRSKALLEGPLASAIVQRLQQGPAPSAMTLEDLAAYKPVEREALCRTYRNIYVVCVPPPPSSGVSLLQALLMLEHTDIAVRKPLDPKAWLRLAEAERLMYADRDRYVGDPAFIQVPVAGLLDPAYVKTRAGLITDRAGPAPVAGVPPQAVAMAPDRTAEPGGTSHFVVVDAQGNVVSMTTTVESLFGTGRMVGGFFLNNQLTDFSFSPVDAGGKPVANAVSGGKRPRSSMAPVIVLDGKGRFVAALGSPGGSSILSYNLKTLVGILDWKLSMQEAISLPNMVARDTTFTSEPDRYSPGVVQGLSELGVTLTPFRGEASGLHGIMIGPDGTLQGGADPRREGVAKAY